MKKIFSVLMVLTLALLPVHSVYAVDRSMTDTDHLGGQGAGEWHIQVDGDIVPEDDSSYDIGATDSEVDNIYTDGLVLGGVEKNSWGSIIDDERISIASGPNATAITLGDGVAYDVSVVFDGGTQDYYMAIDDTGGDTEDLFTIGLGSVIGTTPALGVDSANDVRVLGNNDLIVGASDGSDIQIGVDLTTDGTNLYWMGMILGTG